MPELPCSRSSSLADPKHPPPAPCQAPPSNELPADWCAHTCSSSGNRYYYNIYTRQTSWERPNSSKRTAYKAPTGYLTPTITHRKLQGPPAPCIEELQIQNNLKSIAWQPDQHMEAIKYKSLSQLARKNPGVSFSLNVCEVPKHVQIGSTMVRWSYIKRAARRPALVVPCIKQHEQSVTVQKEGAKGSKTLGHLINQMIGGSTKTSVCVHGRRKTQCKDCGTGYCKHKRQKYQCKDCGTGHCPHGHRLQDRINCKVCHPSVTVRQGQRE
jgi:hypothetical protein